MARSRKRVRTDQERVFAVSYKLYRQNARARGLEFLLTREQAYALFARPCTYCGRTDVKCDHSNKPKICCVCTGIDRVDNTRGYVVDNCAPCCTRCNKAKSDLSREEWHAWLLAITTYQKAQSLGRPYA